MASKSGFRYHGRWILTKKWKKKFAVEIEKTELNILEKKLGKKLFLGWKKKKFNLINPNGVLTSSCHL